MATRKVRMPKSGRMDTDATFTELEGTFARRLAHRLRALRIAHNLTQEYVAYQAGISTFTYQKFEKGESYPGKPMNPRLSTLIALAQVFGLEPWELVRFDDLSVNDDRWRR